MKQLLYDNGVGADARRNDGIYSSYFNGYNQNGRYNVIVRVRNYGEAKKMIGHQSFNAFRNTNNKNTKQNISISVNDFEEVYAFNDSAVTLEPVGQFTRAPNAGAFKVTGWTGGQVDRTPPSRVIDLRVKYVDQNRKQVELQWTAAGDDYNTGVAKQILLRGFDIKANEVVNDEAKFTSGIAITSHDVVVGSLVPVNGNQLQQMTIKIPDQLWANAKSASPNASRVHVNFALKTVDHAGNTAEVSNIASAHFGILKARNYLFNDNILMGEQAITLRVIVNVSSSDIKNPTDPIVFTISSDEIPRLDVTFRAPSKEVIDKRSPKLVRDDINQQIRLVYGGDGSKLDGVWEIIFYRKAIKLPEARISISTLN